MATVTAIFSGNLTDATNTSAATAVTNKPALYLLNPGPGSVKLSVDIAPAAASAVVTVESEAVSAGRSIQFAPPEFEEPFALITVRTVATGVCTGIKVHMVET